MKILWKGPVFNPTGISTAAREMIKALVRKGVKVQVTDPWHSKFDFNEGLKDLNNPIDVKNVDATIFYDYPQFWRDGYGKLIGHFIHEGTKLFPGWAEQLNKVEKLFVASEANKSLFKWNEVVRPTKVINYGVNTEIYKPRDLEKAKEFIFLSVNSWTGEVGDRKGTDLLIRAFNAEFKEQSDVKLLLKISTFWDEKGIEYYMQRIIHLCGGKMNPNILVNATYLPEDKLAENYNRCDCFVAPTRGEGFGLTILNSLASGLPVIVTKDKNSGHYDFCKDNPAVMWIETKEVKQGDPRFYVEGNMLAEPDLESLKKQMRSAYNNRAKLKELGAEGSKKASEFTWDQTAEQIIEYVRG